MYFFSRLDSLLCAADSTIITRILVCVCVCITTYSLPFLSTGIVTTFLLLAVVRCFTCSFSLSVCVPWCLVVFKFMHSTVLFAHNHSFSCTLIPEPQYQ